MASTPKKYRDIPEPLTQNAREFRHHAPIPERILWGLLRDGRLFGLKFRRQHPVPPYVLDFYCSQYRTAIELDGESHVGRAGRDDARTQYLNKRNIRVIRVTNDDLLTDPVAAAEYIAEQISPGITKAKTPKTPKTPSPQPSPGGRGSQTPSPPGRGLG